MLKKTFAVLGTLALAFTLASCGGAKSDEQLMEEGWVKNPTEHGYVKNPEENGYVKAPAALPAAPASFKAGDSVINKTNLGDYMNRSDVTYIDLRGVEDAYITGHIKGFETVEYFGFMKGNGEQLFTADNQPRYVESVQILNTLFPKNQTIFLMCQSGGRVKGMMALLEAQKYDMSKVYNVTGWNDLSADDSTVKDLCKPTPFAAGTVTYPFDKLEKLA